MSQFAYQPGMVYSGIVVMMLLSGFGLPIPEEITLISTGLLAFMGANPQLFPPPFDGAPVVNPIDAAIVATFAVFGADFIIYCMGRFGGRKLIQHPRLRPLFPDALLGRAEGFVKRYGAFATGLFRFTPGIRFPGHLLCGMLHFPAWKFALIDGLAVCISVPTQILLLAHYGEPILITLKKFKLIVLGAIGIALIAFIAMKVKEHYKNKNAAKEAGGAEKVG